MFIYATFSLSQKTLSNDNDPICFHQSTMKPSYGPWGLNVKKQASNPRGHWGKDVQNVYKENITQRNRLIFLLNVIWY